FKHLLLRSRGAAHQRLLRSSGTSGGATSQIALDEESSALQARSSLAILREMVGSESVPLLVLDRAASLRQRDVRARVVPPPSRLRNPLRPRRGREDQMGRRTRYRSASSAPARVRLHVRPLASMVDARGTSW